MRAQAAGDQSLKKAQTLSQDEDTEVIISFLSLVEQRGTAIY